MKLSPRITLIPFLHGRIGYAEQVRHLCLSQHFDCIAVDLPPHFALPLTEAIDELPFISAITAEHPDEPLYFIPTDPCDATIEALRQGAHNNAQRAFIGAQTLRAPSPLPPLPDEAAIPALGFEAYASLLLRTLDNYGHDGPEDGEAQHCAQHLRELESRHSRVLALVHFRHFARTVYHYGREESYNGRFDTPTAYESRSCLINPDHLYFALGELPFFTAHYEKARYSPILPQPNPFGLVKALFCDTRDNYYDNKVDIETLSPVRLQAALTFLRNLTVLSSTLMPSLFDIVSAAKGVGGNSYAVRILKNAQYYPFLPIEQGSDYLRVGIDRVRLPGEKKSRAAINLFKDTAVVWRTLSIRPEPSLTKKKDYRYQWNPQGMCSHTPEDHRIEQFNGYLRNKAKRVISEDLIRTEKFTTSVHDGIDIRETLRNWHSGALYVKELPPARGDIDTVVIIFDDQHDERYSHLATWYAEHNEESTLTFYATDPFAEPIGPGICRAYYGGLSLVFPPRSLPNIFSSFQGVVSTLPTLSHRLTYGALLFSNERTVAYVAAKKPDALMRSHARALGKHLVWLPLSSFSTETLARLRRFHVLNGQEVRSWATRFIG
jgi:hypothetical protein